MVLQLNNKQASSRSRVILNHHWVCHGEEFWQLQQDWERCFSPQANSVFMSWPWVANWWLSYAQDKRWQPRILVIKNDLGAVKAIFPFYCIASRLSASIPVEHWHILAGGSSAGTDYLGMVGVLQNEQEWQAAWSLIANRLRLNSLLWLKDCDPVFAQAAIKAVSQTNGIVSQELESTTCPVVPLQDDWQSHLAGLSRNFRSQLRRAEKKLDALDGWSIQCAVTQHEIQQPISSIQELNQCRMQSKGIQSSFTDPKLARFLESAALDLAAHQQSRLYYLLDPDSEVTAAAYIVDDGHDLYYYLGGFKPEIAKLGPMNLLFIRVLQDAYRLNRASLNMLKGDESYKYRWGAIAQQLPCYVVTKASLSSQMLLKASDIQGRIKLRFSQWLGRSR